MSEDLTHDLPEPRRTSLEALDRAAASSGCGYIIGDFPASGQSVSIDCESRLDLCHAACCRLRFALSADDLQAGILRWDPEQPFLILQDTRGCCTHLQQPARRCGAYDHRPGPCRSFDCRQDERIWLSFENRRVNPAVTEACWPLAPMPPASTDANRIGTTEG